MLKKIQFIPELELDISEAPAGVTVKGRVPSTHYAFTMVSIYPTIPALDPLQAYQKIKQEFERVDGLLAGQLKLRGHFETPIAKNAGEARYILGILFDPSQYFADGLWRQLDTLALEPGHMLQLGEVYPYPLRLAPPKKLIHTLIWIDTNIKVSVESLAQLYHLPPAAIRQIVESALKIYAYLVKQDDYYLARSINFNYSMFLQERILNLLFGDNIYRTANSPHERGKLANTMALELLKNLGEVSYPQLCTLSVFMGILWMYREDVQQEFLSNASSALAKIDTQLNTMQSEWCINHVDLFLADIGQDPDGTVTVILDDNGESVFDAAIFQKILDDTGNLKVDFVVNYFPISENIDLHTFQTLLDDPYFASLRQHFATGRARLQLESQVFRSFELAHLRSQTKQAIQQSKCVYIKGANFFETFQVTDVRRYHCFTVFSPTSEMLTGCPNGKGIFVRLNPGQIGYTYHSEQQVETLFDTIQTPASD